MKMKYLLGLLLVLVAGNALALPHDNRSDVGDTVKEFIPWNDFSVTADGTSILSIGSGTPRVAEVNSLGLGAIKTDAISDRVNLFYQVPSNACVGTCPIKISVLWSTSSSTTSQTATWRVLYSAKAIGEALAAGSTTLDTAITADSVLGTAYMLNESPQGVIAANTLSRSDILNIVLDLASVSGLNPGSDTVLIHGIYIEYTRELL